MTLIIFRKTKKFFDEFILFSSHLVNTLYDLSKKLLFFIESTESKKYLSHLKKSKTFFEVSKEMGYWYNGMARLKKEDKFIELFKNVANSIQMFCNLLWNMNLLSHIPGKNKLPKLSNPKKKSINSIGEIEGCSSNNNRISKNMLITFTNLDESIKKKEKAYENNGSSRYSKIKLNNMYSKETPSNLFQITFSEKRICNKLNSKKNLEKLSSEHPVFKKSKVSPNPK